MKLQTISRLPLAVGAIGLISLTACSALRQVTYPPGFTWLDQSTVTSTMYQMGQHIQRLNLLMAQSEPSPVEQQRAIVHELGLLEQVAAGLVGSGGPDQTAPRTNHLLIDEQIDTFMDSVSLALLQASAEPPNYYATGQLTGSCAACHTLR